MQTLILGVPVHTCTFQEALNTLLAFLNEERPHTCYTPNPEMIMAAQKDPQFMETLKNGSLVVPDGIGVVLASRFTKLKMKERVAGCDLVQALFKQAATRPMTVYLLGGAPQVCPLAKKRIEAQYPGVTVVGFHHGYFDTNAEQLIVEDIQRLRPDILLAGLGFPKQEKWIATHCNQLPVRLLMGVGGTLDVLAGTVKRAPRLFQKLGLEWLYRLLKQPQRIGRMLQLPLFMLYVIVKKER